MLVTLWVAQTPSEEIPVRIARPSAVLREFASVLPPNSVRADDGRRVLILLDPDPEVKRTALRFVRRYDRPSPRVRLSFRIRQPFESDEVKVMAEIPNQHTYRLTDDPLGLDLRVTPVVNFDGTITTRFEVHKLGGGRANAAVRLRRNQAAFMNFSEGIQFATSSRRSHPMPSQIVFESGEVSGKSGGK